MAVSVSRIRKDVNEILKTLGERIVFYADKAVEITQKVNEIIDMYHKSNLFILNEDNLANRRLDELTEIVRDAERINIEYEKFLKGSPKINYYILLGF
jgi:hypothetical protein